VPYDFTHSGCNDHLFIALSGMRSAFVIQNTANIPKSDET